MASRATYQHHLSFLIVCIAVMASLPSAKSNMNLNRFESAKLLDQNPPKRLHSHGSDASRKVVTAGQAVHISCPVEKEDSAFINWFKDGTSITSHDSHIRVASSGILRIKEVALEDTGFYLCRAVNGFGSVEIGVNLIVLEKDPSSEGTNSSSFDLEALKPRLTQVSKFPDPVIERPVGGIVRFKCEAIATPRPTISWFYNHQLLPNKNQVARRSRWTLVMNELEVEDSGNYTCFVANAHGNTSASFVLQVIERERRKPELTGPHPENVTVALGARAAFHCQVRSEVIPHIQWLKKIDSMSQMYDSRGSGVGSPLYKSSADELVSSSSHSHIVTVDGQHYRVLRSSSSVADGADGVFTNTLKIDEAKETDVGGYVCRVGSAVTSRTAYLRVISHPSTAAFPPQLVNPAQELFLPTPIIVATIAISVLVLVSVSFLIVHCRSQKRQNSSSGSPSIESNSGRLTICTNSPKHQANRKLVASQQLVLEHPLRRPSPFGQAASNHHYSPVHSSGHHGDHRHQMSHGYSPAPSSSAFTPHPSELIQITAGLNQHHHHLPHHHQQQHQQQHSQTHQALLVTSENKTSNRSSSVSPAFNGGGGGANSGSLGGQSSAHYHQYYHIPQMTSYGYLC